MTTMRTGSSSPPRNERLRSGSKTTKDTTKYAAAAELIMKVPPEVALHNTPGPRWADREHPSFQKTSRYAQIEDLAKLSFIILKHGDHGRTVKLGNRTLMEGHLESLLALAEDEQAEAESGTRPRGTPAINKSKMN